jgi:hypothetical protein
LVAGCGVRLLHPGLGSLRHEDPAGDPMNEPYDPDAILADPKSHPLQQIYAKINIGIRDRGEHWEKCRQCGKPYRVTEQWLSQTLCSEACINAFARYIDEDW